MDGSYVMFSAHEWPYMACKFVRTEFSTKQKAPISEFWNNLLL